MEVIMPSVKEKRRNSEKRKEKSRDAARCRRSRESEIFSALSQVLPLPASVTSHLDKASIMRLVIAHLRIRDLIKKSPKESDCKDDTYDSLYLKALGGVILVLSLDGEIIYISSNVPTYLGVSQVDLLGHSIYDVSHPCDHNEIRDLLSGKVMSEGNVSVFLRVKCTLSNKGRSFNIKTASYKVLHITGNFVSACNDENQFRFVTIANPIPHPVDIEAPLGTYTFLSKHSLDMKFTYADERMKDFLGYSPDSLIGKSLYNYHHVQDNKDIEGAFRSLFAKGQSETGHYRFLAQGGGYAWVYTQATLIYSDKGNKPQSVVCVNYVVSEKLNVSEIYSLEQLEWERKTEKSYRKKEEPVVKNQPVAIVQPQPQAQTQSPSRPLQRPEPATQKIFAKKTKDMNTRFLMFTDNEPAYTVMKDEPVDLTHLAPVAGDVCVPLDIPPLLNEVVGNYMLDSNDYSPLINEDKDAPLFSSYRDDCSSGSLSPALTQSPGGCSLPPLCSLGEESPFEESAMKTLLGIESDSVDLDSRAPYLPLGESEDLPLLMPSDFWNVSYSLGSGSSSSSARCSPSPMEVKPHEDFSNISHLLQAEKEDSMNSYPDQGGGSNTYRFNNFIDTPMLDSECRKRGSSVGQESAKKRKQTFEKSNQGKGDSVLMNLLVAGRDLSAGYVCINPCVTVASLTKHD